MLELPLGLTQVMKLSDKIMFSGLSLLRMVKATLIVGLERLQIDISGSITTKEVESKFNEFSPFAYTTKAV